MQKAARVPPQSLEAEQAVLGCGLLTRSALHAAEAMLCPEDFYREAHRIIFQTAIAMDSRGEPVDEVTIASELEKRGQLEQAGGRPYLFDLWRAMPSAGHVEHYAKIVKERSALRRLIAIGDGLVEECFGDAEDPEAIAGSVEQALRDVRAAKSRQRMAFSDIVAEARDRYRESDLHPREVTGLPTGLRSLDLLTNGIQRGNLSLLSARQGGGKTSLAMQIALHTAREGGRVLYHALEMSEAETVDRMVSNAARINGLDLARGILTPAEQEMRSDATLELDGLPIEIDTACPVTPVYIRNAARELLDAGLALVVVDYIGLVKGGRRFDSRVEEENFVAHELRAAAKELGVPVLALSQHRKPAQGYSKRAPELFEIRGGSGPIDDAALVLMLEDVTKDEEGSRNPLREIMTHVTKNRFGPCGEIPLMFREEHTRFYEQRRGGEGE